jgi:hypothetical protein
MSKIFNADAAPTYRRGRSGGGVDTGGEQT